MMREFLVSVCPGEYSHISQLWRARRQKDMVPERVPLPVRAFFDLPARRLLGLGWSGADGDSVARRRRDRGMETWSAAHRDRLSGGE